MRTRLAALWLLLLATQAHAACTTGQTTCNTDTVNAAAIGGAIRDPGVQERVYQLWLSECLSIWSEAASTIGNLRRDHLCDQVAAGGISKELLTAIVMNATVQGEVLAALPGGACTIPAGTNAAAGCMVDVDVRTAIDVALTVTQNNASTTATQAVVGSTLIVVASATGIAEGQSVYGAGIPAGAVVTNVSGTSIAISLATVAALSLTPVLFTVSTGLP